MKIDILGGPQAGQSELFSLLTGIALDTVQQKPLEIQQGVCEVRDPRITRLKEMYNPQKTAYAKIEYTLLPALANSGPAKTQVLNELKNADEICFVTKDESAESDINQFISELVIADLMLAEKRLENLAKDQKKKYQETREKEKSLMDKIKARLDSGKPLSLGDYNEEERKALGLYQLYTLKPVFIVINSAEDRLKDNALLDQLADEYNLPAIRLSLDLERELLSLPDDDRKAYMKEVGLLEAAIDKMNRLAYEGLGMISYFTVGTDEVRAWSTRKGSNAAEAGAVIHTDISKGFVRAEMFKYQDLIELGSEAKVKESGKFHLKGRDYIVEDADILSFRFNV